MNSKTILGVCALVLQQAAAADIDYNIDVDVMAMGQYLDQKDGYCNTYLGELLSVEGDVRVNGSFGLDLNVISDKRCIDDRLPEVNTAYFYYVFDWLGEMHLGHDKPIDQYIKSTEGNIFENRAISSYFNCPAGSFNKYTIVDDHSALRVMWLSPTVKGFKLGISYMPNSSVCRGSSSHYARDLFSLGLAYEGGTENLTYGLSSVGYLGRSYYSSRHGVKSVAFEGKLAYKGWELDGRAILDGNSLQPLASDNFDTAYSIDLSYTIKDTKLSIGHLVSHRTDKTFETSKGYTAGIQHKLGNYNIFTKYTRLNNSKGNNGHVVMLGVSRKFNWGN